MSDYDDRHYRRMLNLIADYGTAQIGLRRLAGDIEGLIVALEDVSENVRDQLLSLWSPIEVAYARECDGEKLQPSDLEKLREHIEDLRYAIAARLKESSEGAE
jgi:hypothetical protein